jgi:hypothetical protein
MNVNKDVLLYLLSLFNLGTILGGVFDATPVGLPPARPPPPPTREKDPLTMVQEAVWVPGPIWTGEEDLAALGFNPRTVQPVA